MSSETTTLGQCPYCRHDIPAIRKLIEYERGDTRAIYAECPECSIPVHPTEGETP